MVSDVAEAGFQSARLDVRAGLDLAVSHDRAGGLARVENRGLAGARAGMAAYAAQLALNLAWSFLFFGGWMIGIALAGIVLLLGAIGVNAVLFWRTDRLAGWLLAPYAAWVAFACVLNFALWRLN